jgi:hypothetical protein
MKLRAILVILVIIVTVLNAQEFPVGVYICTDSLRRPNTNYEEIKEMGVNWVVEYADNNTKPNLDSLNVIALNSDSEKDLILHYTAGYYSKWEAEEGASLALDYSNPGIRHEAGIQAGSYWRANKQTPVGKKIVCGPYYEQARTYNLGYNMNVVRYKANFMLRYVAVPSENTYPVCKIMVRYTILDQDLSGYFQISETLEERVLNSDELSSTFDLHTLTYSVPEKIQTKSTLMDYPHLDKLTSTKYPPYGVEFIVEWLDDSQLGTLDIDYIEVFEDQIWSRYFNNEGDINPLILNYANRAVYQNWNNLKYWYGVDEPYTIDQYIPYKKINDLLTSNGYPGLISAFYPNWAGKRNWEISSERFLNIVQPEKLMYDYYPYWAGTTNDQGLKTQQITIQTMFNDTPEHDDYFNNCFFLAQANAYWDWDADDSVSVPFKRWPNNSMLRANVMLALAHGAKGIFFWNYFSYLNPDDTYRCLGIVDINNVKSELYYEIKDTLAPRLKGALGDTLSNIDYTTKYDYKKINVVDDSNQPNDSKDKITFLEILNTSQNTDTLNFHIGLLENPVDTDRKYLMIGNMKCAVPTKSTDLMLGISNPLSKYVNYNLRNVESQFNYNKTINLNGTNSFIDTITFSAGDGHLYELKPVLKYGGSLVYDDTVKTAITLTEAMTIKPNATLTLNKVYSISEDIYVEDGGMVETNLYGGIAFSNNAELLFADWSDGLVISQNDTHPKLYWTEYPSEESTVKYEIYRKKDSPNFQLVHTITDKSITEFTDTDVDIMLTPAANPTNAKYYVKVYERPTKVWIEQDQTITVTITPVYGEAPAKKLAEGIAVTEFALEQNHPNPFNPTTVITYQVPKQSHVTIKVYDILGKEIIELVNSTKATGIYNVTFDASNLSSGTYIYRMDAGKYVESKKMIILK